MNEQGWSILFLFCTICTILEFGAQGLPKENQRYFLLYPTVVPVAGCNRPMCRLHFPRYT